MVAASSTPDVAEPLAALIVVLITSSYGGEAL
jgi:hypothetical protein